MVSINIGAGQGVTQAIATKLGLSKDDLKKINLSTWQNVMTEVNNAQSRIDAHNASNPNDKQQSIFSGGRDVNSINQKSNWKNNFVVQQGTVEIDDSAWNKIVQLLTGKTPASDEAKKNLDPSENKKPQSLAKDPDFSNEKLEPQNLTKPLSAEKIVEDLDGKIIERSVDGKNQNIAVVEINGQKVRRAINPDGTLGDAIAATKTFGKNEYISGDFPAETKILEREVNGKKQQIGVFEDENGNKVRKLVTTDPETGKTTLGENLVTVSTMGKNKYVTETKFNSDVKTMLGLGDDEEIPADLKAEYVTIGGESQLVIKKDGKVMDSNQLKQFMSDYRANDTKLAEEFDKAFDANGQAEIKDAAKLAKSQMALINNKYGDKTGNINADEYFNYQLADQENLIARKLNDDEKANLRAMSDLVFKTLDADQSQEITEQELIDYINNANADNNNILTGEEVENYTNKKLTEMQTKNVNNASQAGYGLSKISTEYGEMPVFVKDGKTFMVNMDGTVGAEIVPEGAENAVETPAQSADNNVKSTQDDNKDYLPGDIRSLSPKDRTNAQIDLLKSGKIREGAFVQIGEKLVTMEDGKFVTYDKGKINRQEISESDLRKLGEE